MARTDLSAVLTESVQRAYAGRRLTSEQLREAMLYAVHLWNEQAGQAWPLVHLPPQEPPASLSGAGVARLRKTLFDRAEPNRWITSIEVLVDDDGHANVRVEHIDLAAVGGDPLAVPEVAVGVALSGDALDDARLRAMLGRHHAATVRKLLREALETRSAALFPRAETRFLRAFAAVGGPGNQARRLAALAEDRTVESERAAIAATVLVAQAPEVAAESPVLARRARDHETERLVASVLEVEGAAELFVDFLAKVVPHARPNAFAELDAARRRMGIPAREVWTAVARRRDLGPVADVAREVLAEDHGALAPDTERELAWMTAPDGQSAFSVGYARAGSHDRWNVYGLVLRESGTIRDGLYQHQLSPDELAHFMSRLESGMGRVARVPPAVVSAVVAAATRRAQAPPSGLDADARVALDMILRVEPDPDPDPAPGPLPSDLAHLRSIDGNLALTRGWFFDRADLRTHGAPPPGTPGWRAAAAQALASDDLLARCRGILAHAARYLHHRGQHEDARRMAASRAALTLESFPNHPLVALMLDITEQALASPGGATRDDPLGDPGTRAALRRLPELHTAKPRRLDLAKLDVAELFACAEWTLAAEVPGLSKAPSPTRQRALVHAAAEVTPLLVSMTTGRRPLDRAALDQALVTALTRDLGPELAAPVATQLLTRLLRFLVDTCEACPMACWRSPDVKARGAWSADAHPAFGDPLGW